jgi:hypothetical protein
MLRTDQNHWIPHRCISIFIFEYGILQDSSIMGTFKRKSAELDLVVRKQHHRLSALGNLLDERLDELKNEQDHEISDPSAIRAQQRPIRHSRSASVSVSLLHHNGPGAIAALTRAQKFQGRKKHRLQNMIRSPMNDVAIDGSTSSSGSESDVEEDREQQHFLAPRPVRPGHSRSKSHNFTSRTPSPQPPARLRSISPAGNVAPTATESVIDDYASPPVRHNEMLFRPNLMSPNTSKSDLIPLAAEMIETRIHVPDDSAPAPSSVHTKPATFIDTSTPSPTSTIQSPRIRASPSSSNFASQGSGPAILDDDDDFDDARSVIEELEQEQQSSFVRGTEEEQAEWWQQPLYWIWSSFKTAMLISIFLVPGLICHFHAENQCKIYDAPFLYYAIMLSIVIFGYWVADVVVHVVLWAIRRTPYLGKHFVYYVHNINRPLKFAILSLVILVIKCFSFSLMVKTSILFIF